MMQRPRREDFIVFYKKNDNQIAPNLGKPISVKRQHVTCTSLQQILTSQGLAIVGWVTCQNCFCLFLVVKLVRVNIFLHFVSHPFLFVLFYRPHLFVSVLVHSFLCRKTFLQLRSALLNFAWKLLMVSCLLWTA